MLGGINPLMMGAGGAAALKPQDVFATSLYTGNGSSQTITTGLDMATHGGLVWGRARASASDHWLSDTVRGRGVGLFSNTTAGNQAAAAGQDISSFNSNGFTVGTPSNSSMNSSSAAIVAWSFRRAPKFFDVVTYTGNGTSGRTIAHNLGIAPGLVIVKCTSNADDWYVKHRSASTNDVLSLNSTTAAYGDTTTFGTGFSFNSTTFQIGTTGANQSGRTYIAYLFAHDTAADGVVQCGSYTGNGSNTGPTITLGWQPQYLLVKRTDASANWFIWDSARSTSNPRTSVLIPNSSNTESTSVVNSVDLISSGFQIKYDADAINFSGGTFVYLAIRAPI